MRSIETPEDLARKEKRNRMIISIVMLAILLFSTLGFAFLYNEKDSSGSVGSKGKVQNYGDRWGFSIGDQTFMFLNSPENLTEISVNISSGVSSFVGKPLYIVSNSSEIYNEIASNIGRYSERAQPACYGKCDLNLPEKDCSDNLIVFSKSDDKQVFQRDNCIFIEGDMKSVDAFLYKLFGIN